MVEAKGMRPGIAMLVAVLLPLAPLPAPAAHLSPVLNQSQLVERISGDQAPPLIDVRTPGEYQSGHIPGAINIPLQEFPQRMGELGAYREREVVLYCESGMRASRGGEWLKSQGFEELRYLDGHMMAWRQSGLPTER